MIDCKELKAARVWLDEAPGGKRSPKAPDANAQAFIDQIQEEMGAGHRAIVMKLLDMIEQDGRSIRSEVNKGRLYVEAALALVELRDEAGAAGWLQRARSAYCGHPHEVGTVNWMLGLLEWDLPGRARQADSDWQAAIGCYEQLEGNTCYSDQSGWYHDRVCEMTAALQAARRRFPPGGTAAAVRPSPFPPPVKPPKSPPDPRPSRRHSLRGPAYYASVHAGAASSSSDLGSSSGYAEIRQFYIEDRPYDYIELPGKSRLQFPCGGDLAFIKVVGDSMNRAGIDSGDFVLLKYRQSPENGDIVVAEWVNNPQTSPTADDNRATLKRYYRHGDTIELRPESTNPRHRKITVPPEQAAGLSIRGVVVGILKPAQAL